MKQTICYKVILLHFISPIAIGGLIYILFRPTYIYLFYWSETIGLYGFVLRARDLIDIAGYLPTWVIYSLPNGLWAYSFMVLMSFIWGYTKSLKKTIFIVIVVALSLGSELFQLLGLVPGTFCLVDIVLYIIGLSVGYYMGMSYHRAELLTHLNSNVKEVAK